MEHDKVQYECSYCDSDSARQVKARHTVRGTSQWRRFYIECNITVKRALQMCDGLDIDEVYLPLSGVTDMLFNKHALVDTVRSIGIDRRI